MSGGGAAAAVADTAAWYRRWADVETAGASPTYERLARAVAADAAVLALLARLPRSQRQPNVLLAALRWHDAPVDDPPAALAWVRDHPDQVLHVLRTRTTQTNEPARCALLLPALAQLAAGGGPLALVEVGASAGLCLLPDAWGYRYATAGGVHAVGPPDAAVVLPCAVTGGPPLPAHLPAVSWRAGLDLRPLDPADPDVRRWLACLVWPEHADRAARLGAALDVAAAARPEVVRGDMTRDLPALLRRARAAVGPAGTVVVTHSAALVYLDDAGRARVQGAVSAAGAHLLGAEAASVLPGAAARLPRGIDPGGRFVVTLDGRPLALAHPHGASLHWL